MAQSTTGGTSSRRHLRDHDTASITSSKYADTEWEAKEALRQRELEEARARAAQMEKTMRWWSDCTANWREKWSKVRNERNKSREEAKQLRMKLDTSMKEAALNKREKSELETQNENLKKEIEKIHILLLKHAGQFDSQIFEALGSDLHNNENSETELDALNHHISNNENGTECDDSLDLLDMCKGDACEEYVLQGAVPKLQNPESGEYVHSLKLDDLDRDDKTEKLCRLKDEADEDYLIQKISMLQLRLEESNKTIHTEREEKNQLHKSLEKINTELQEVKEKCEELKAARQDAVRELLVLQDRYKDEVKLIRADLQDEASSREGMDRRLMDLRAELERLQAENAAEWGKRERLETEKLSLERDNKKLRSELRDMQERLERKGRPISTTDVEMRQVQQDLSDKNKEISELKHSHAKLKKMMNDKMTELAHAMRRAEQYETEVKKLRTRVEELKKDLAVAEDEVDTATNNIRKLQRTNDELQEQVENFQVQLQHLHTRLRNSGSSSLLSHRSQTLLAEDGSDEEMNEY